ncbi:hypothetical protein OQA88_3320 [Cercophora sp. LCS_1]
MIINKCNNIGIHSVFDPGPPPSSFACKTERALCPQTGAAHVAPTESVTQRPTMFTAPIPTPTTSSATQTPPQPKTTTLPTHLSSSSTPTSTSASTTSASPLSQGAKIAIGVCSALALAAFIAMALLILYRRKRHRSRRTHNRLPPSSSPTPLISPANATSTPLTPPLRLRDRRFLPAMLRAGNRSPSPPLTPLTPAYFPASPICSPTTNKLIPRHERTPHPGGELPPVVFGMGVVSRGSLSSTGPGTGQSSLRNEIPGTPPSSPTRPPRPFEGPLEIPDLVSPAPVAPLPRVPGGGNTASFTAVGGRGVEGRGSWGSWDSKAMGGRI